MGSDEATKKQYLSLFKEFEGLEPEQVINAQVQTVTRELARLVGLIEGGLRVTGPDSREFKKLNSPEFKELRKAGSKFLDELVHIAKKLKIQLQ